MQFSSFIKKIERDKGLDLSGYKDSTLKRRIERRMHIENISSLKDYARFIDVDSCAYERLVGDFFIGVTDFFRDKRIWNIIGKDIISELVNRHTQAGPSCGPLRMWSAGCATGEETYSLAISVKEALRKENIKHLTTFIYGTDIREDKLRIAKKAIYSEEKLTEIDNDIKSRYFELTSQNIKKSKTADKHYKIDASVKRITRFRKYDLVKPEVLAGFDMVVCRNVLIYFKRQLQEKVLKHFYKTLRHGGILWLGKSETLSKETAVLFKPIHRKEKIFRKI